MSLIRGLVGMREILSDPAQWCAETMYMDESDQPVHMWTRDVQRYCAYGAAMVCGGKKRQALVELLDAQAKKRHGKGWDITEVNDRLGRLAVLACVDAVLAELRSTRTMEGPKVNGTVPETL